MSYFQSVGRYEGSHAPFRGGGYNLSTFGHLVHNQGSESLGDMKARTRHLGGGGYNLSTFGHLVPGSTYLYSVFYYEAVMRKKG